MSGHRPKHSTPVPIASRLDPKALLAQHQRLLVEFDRMTTKVMLAEREARRMSCASGQRIGQVVAARHRAETAEAALAAAQSTPVAAVRLLLRAERELYRLTYPTCPSCKLTATHRPNCRLMTLIHAIEQLFPI